MTECDHCEFEAETYQELRTHVLLKHPETMDDTEEYESEVSDEYLGNETRADKGEQFGYR